jgi:hypothetical protein
VDTTTAVLTTLIIVIGLAVTLIAGATSRRRAERLRRRGLPRARLPLREVPGYAAVPLMIAQKSGVIVNVASEAGLVGIKGQVVYNVSKGAMIALTRSCAVDLAEYGIRVNSVCPGTTETPLVRAALQRAADPAEARRRLEQCRPANRLGTPQEIAAAILFLASDEGQKFFAEGGNVAPANPSPAIQQLWIDSFGETEVNIQAFVDATYDSQGVTVFDEIWDAINTELVVKIFDLNMSVEDTVAETCDFINSQLP